MCGRYYVNEEASREIEKLVRHIDYRLNLARTGDVRPSQSAVILTGKQPDLTAEEMKWGFFREGKKSMFINARAETVRERKTFRDSVLHRRCIIPAGHFYEWDASKNKISFRRTDSPVLYMAGFYRKFQEEERFIILTTQANESVASVHERMPLILEEKELAAWIYDDANFSELLHKVPVGLEKCQEFEQQSLFFS